MATSILMSRVFAVHRSPISGKGCFATKRIRKGQRIAEYTGERISSEESDERYQGTPFTMLFDVGDGSEFIDGGVGGSGIEYANTGCSPNCEPRTIGRRVFIHALRPIEPGEELVYDYGLYIDGPWLKRYARDYRCACGSRRCRGIYLRSPRPPKAERERLRALAKKRSV